MNEFMRTVLNLPPQASTVANDIDYLHYAVIGTSVLGSIGVALVIVVFVIRYRKGAGRRNPRRRAVQEQMPRMPIRAELVIVGFLLFLFTSWWVIGYRQYLDINTPPADSLDVYVVGKKWMWSFAYPGGGGSKGVLYVPVNRPVRLVMTSRDVIHSFYVPAFRIKQDAVPGRATTAWFEATRLGRYDLLCAEYCGTGHSDMRGEVVVLPADEYAERIDGLPAGEIARQAYRSPVTRPGRSREERLTMAERGERAAAELGCLRCHTVDGTPHIGPSWARVYGSPVLMQSGAWVIADEAYLTESMMDPRAVVRYPFKPVMPSYQGLMSSAQAAAIVEFIRTLRDVPLSQPQAPLAVPTGGPEDDLIPRGQRGPEAPRMGPDSISPPATTGPPAPAPDDRPDDGGNEGGSE